MNFKSLSRLVELKKQRVYVVDNFYGCVRKWFINDTKISHLFYTLYEMLGNNFFPSTISILHHRGLLMQYIFTLFSFLLP